jgi:cytochrome c oxidase subunit II
MKWFVIAQLRYVYDRSPSVFSPAGRYAARIAHLGEAMIILATLIFLGVLAVMFTGLWRARGRAIGNDQPAPQVSAERWVLGGGMFMPIIVLGGVFLATLVTLGEAAHSESPAVDVEVVGHQWWWEVRYPREGLTSADEIHVPVGRPVRLHLTSGDVIHSFWLPQLNGKTDLNPASENIMFIEADSAGTYAGRCAEYCGLQHAHMGFSVIAESDGAFRDWLLRSRAPARAPTDSAQSAGLRAFLSSGCGSCHTIRGTPASGKVGPELTHAGSLLTLAGATVANTPANLGGWIADPPRLKPGTMMPALPLDGGSLDAIVQYLESLK